MNEFVFFTTALIDLGLVCLSLRYGVAGLTGMLVTNIILVSALGSKLVSIFGFVTNAGNVFYACTFFAGVMIAEHYGRKEAYKSVWIGFLALLLFVVMSQFTVRSGLESELSSLDLALNQVFRAVPRIALGSMVAYIMSQNINIYVFSAIRQKTGARLVFLRTTASAAIGQFADSIVFFTIAFGGILPHGVLMQAILAGFAVKLGIGIISPFFLKLSYFLKPIDKVNYQKRVT